MQKQNNTLPYPTYDSYKDSGVEWLGEIPRHWEVKKITHLYDNIGSGTTPSSSNNKYYGGNINWLQTGDLNDSKINTTSKRITSLALQHFSTLKIYPVGSLVIAMYGATIGKLGILDIKAATNQACCVLESSAKVATKLMFYVLLGFKENIISMSYGGSQPNISQDLIKSLRLPLPPKSEQTAIANFLDEKCAKIKQAIAQKEALIQLLQERKQIVIQDAVTKGLNPDVPMKDSGVDWIGEIPEHWEVRKLKNACQVIVSNVDKHIRPNETPVRLCNYTDVYKNDCIETTIEFMKSSASPEQVKKFKLKIGDVVITKDSEDWQDIGVPSLIKYEAKDLICGYHLAILRPGNKLEGSYMLRMFQTGFIKLQLSVEAKGITRCGISKGAIKSTLLILPPIEEQLNISEYLENQTTKIDTAIKLQRAQIEQLQAYQRSLIDSAVRGRIKLV